MKIEVLSTFIFELSSVCKDYNAALRLLPGSIVSVGQVSEMHTNRSRLRQEFQCFSRSRIWSHKFPIVAGAGSAVKNYRILVIFVPNLP